MSIVSVADYESQARELLPAPVWGFIAGGSGAELTVRANRALFDQTVIRPRALVDVSQCSTGTKLLGAGLSGPIGIAPTAYQRMACPEGEVATARAAGQAGALMVISMFASRTLEDIAAAATGPLWMQLYWLRRRDELARLAQRAQAAGCRALVLTVDAPRIGRRFRDMRSGFTVDPEITAANLDPELMAAAHQQHAGESAIAAHAAQTFDQTITFADLAWLRGVTDLPLVLKGILSAEDAAAAVDHGVDAIIVSNHGGRQLDGGLPSLRALPEVVNAVAGRCPVLVDGSVQSGRDIFIALALGADAVLIGRPVLWSLAVAGEQGVSHLLGMLRDELEHTMALAGKPSLGDLTRDAVEGASPWLSW